MNQSIAVSHLQLEDETCINIIIIQVEAKGKDKVLFAGMLVHRCLPTFASNPMLLRLY